MRILPAPAVVPRLLIGGCAGAAYLIAWTATGESPWIEWGVGALCLGVLCFSFLNDLRVIKYTWTLGWASVGGLVVLLLVGLPAAVAIGAILAGLTAVWVSFVFLPNLDISSDDESEPGPPDIVQSVDPSVAQNPD